jgi:4-amino-4-deoxy-L-arabinose transferase-like glycosyltransferase
MTDLSTTPSDFRAAEGRFARLAESLFEAAAASHARAVALLLAMALACFLPGFASLQPMDRDEALFAQASKQMVETGDYIDIRFQDEPRHKKPIGIYWLQAGSVTALEAVGVADARDAIWAYRVPSLLGALAAVLLTYWIGLALVSRRGAVLAGFAMATCLSLGVEAHLAKTDAMLLASILVMAGVVVRLYRAGDLAYDPSPRPIAPDALCWRATGEAQRLPQVSMGLALAFWAALGASILIKGPIGAMVIGLMIAALVGVRREGWWLRPLRPALGAPLAALIVAPWLVAIGLATDGAFFATAVGHDLLGKVGTAQTQHWAPPGAYVALLPLTFFPFAALLLLAAPRLVAMRREPAVLALAAWALPTFLVFEAVPTKLPHYVLPTYPAFAIGIAYAIEQGGIRTAGLWRKLVLGLVLVVPLALLVAVPALSLWFDGLPPFRALPFLAFALAFAIVALLAWNCRALAAGALAAGLSMASGAVATYPFAVGEFRAIRLSERLAEAAASVDCASPALGTIGYREPSLVFVTDRSLAVHRDASAMARFLAAPGCRIGFIPAGVEADIRRLLAEEGVTLSLVTRVTGYNINRGIAERQRYDVGVFVKR